jgi:hypothetical protein
MPTELGEVLELLDESPLFHASLGSKELFHSNILAWACHAYPEQLRHVFGSVLCDGNEQDAKVLRVLRERFNLDLVVAFPGSTPLIIENKVKSLPDVDQLCRYDQVAKKFPRASKVLLSFGDDPFEGDSPAGWKHFSYKTLADRLAAALPEIARPFDKDFLREYVSLLELIDRLLAIARISDDSADYFMLDSYKELARHRLHDLFYKVRADHMAKLIRKDVSTLVGSSCEVSGTGTMDRFKASACATPLFLVYSSFTRGTPIVDMFCKPPRADHVFGVQLQENDFKLCMLVQGQRAEREKIAAKFAEGPMPWFSFDILDKQGAGSDASRPTRKSWGSYETDFVYRYKRLPRTMPVSKLLGVFKNYAQDMLRRCSSP